MSEEPEHWTLTSFLAALALCGFLLFCLVLILIAFAGLEVSMK